ncbi:MAG: hypothetical protein QF415_08785 [Candidatus Undinarchaeales archaeon]|nr:hypothetical protein [Candidatus Undinarchaeales archaeon]MDP7491982.1 hypothetical protein [Candidatus Undinarchaeales archaeon]
MMLRMGSLDERTLVVGLLVCFALLTTCFLGTNEGPRFALSLSLGIHGEWHIERFFPDVIYPLFPSMDFVGKDDHIYNGKGPLLSILGAPIVYALWSIGADLQLSVYLTTILLVGLPTALTALLMVRFGRSIHRSGDVDPSVVALAYALCTPAFFYSTVFYSYSIAALLAFASFMLVHRPRWGGMQDAVVAGALAGLVGLADYVTVLFFPGLLLYCYLKRPGWTFPFLVAGGTILSLLLVYSWLLLGDPFGLPFKYHGPFAGSDHGFYYTLGPPTPTALLGLTLGPSRGLFFYSPVLIVAAVLLSRLRRRLSDEVLFIVSLSVLVIVVNAANASWWAGTAFGPRYLVAAMPFFVLPLFTVRREGRLWLVFTFLLLSSFLINLLGAASFYPESDANPVGGLVEEWIGGHYQVMQRSNRPPYEIITNRPKVHILFYRIGGVADELLIRVPTALAFVVGLALFGRATSRHQA